ncbi:MAG TPA: hypothetical protein VE866_00775 [Candidatus Binatia bacterium]|jgi:hypothetical protein|nr:hypothetical protein [Candidatus Binatia bacterium]
MNRILFVLGVAVLFVSTLVVPTTVHADVSGGNGSCGNTICKP